MKEEEEPTEEGKCNIGKCATKMEESMEARQGKGRGTKKKEEPLESLGGDSTINKSKEGIHKDTSLKIGYLTSLRKLHLIYI